MKPLAGTHHTVPARACPGHPPLLLRRDRAHCRRRPALHQQVDLVEKQQLQRRPAVADRSRSRPVSGYVPGHVPGHAPGHVPGHVPSQGPVLGHARAVCLAACLCQSGCGIEHRRHFRFGIVNPQLDVRPLGLRRGPDHAQPLDGVGGSTAQSGGVGERNR
eukprot:scaffold36215_cov84-Isochrysis_galbana.AAC.1